MTPEMTPTEIITLILSVIASLFFVFVFVWACIVLGHAKRWEEIEDEIIEREAE